MRFIKSGGLIFILLLFLVNPCYAEGQTGMVELYIILYGLTFCFYIFIIGGLILLFRKVLGFKSSNGVKWMAFVIGFVLQ